MSDKQVQRFVRLTKLVPNLLKRADDKSMGFTTTVELSFISPKNQKSRTFGQVVQRWGRRAIREMRIVIKMKKLYNENRK